MSENRISNFLPLPELTPAVAGMSPGFIACPMLMIAGYSPVQQSYVAEVYRRAQEMTEAQLRKPAPRRTSFEFSRN